MAKKENPAGAGTLDGADCSSERYCNQSALDQGKNKVASQSYAIVRQDMPPQEWWDGYYFGPALAKSVAEYWSKQLGIPCYAIRVSWPALPERGFHMTCKVAS
jgi:hypothetical protein